MFSLVRLFSPNHFRGAVVCLKRLRPLCRDAEDLLPDVRLDKQKLVPRHCGQDRGYPTVIGSGPRVSWRLAITMAAHCLPLGRPFSLPDFTLPFSASLQGSGWMYRVLIGPGPAKQLRRHGLPLVEPYRLFPIPSCPSCAWARFPREFGP